VWAKLKIVTPGAGTLTCMKRGKDLKSRMKQRGDTGCTFHHGDTEARRKANGRRFAQMNRSSGPRVVGIALASKIANVRLADLYDWQSFSVPPCLRGEIFGSVAHRCSLDGGTLRTPIRGLTPCSEEFLMPTG